MKKCICCQVLSNAQNAERVCKEIKVLNIEKMELDIVISSIMVVNIAI